MTITNDDGRWRWWWPMIDCDRNIIPSQPVSATSCWTITTTTDTTLRLDGTDWFVSLVVRFERERENNGPTNRPTDRLTACFATVLTSWCDLRVFPPRSWEWERDAVKTYDQKVITLVGWSVGLLFFFLLCRALYILVVQRRVAVGRCREFACHRESKKF